MSTSRGGRLLPLLRASMDPATSRNAASSSSRLLVHPPTSLVTPRSAMSTLSRSASTTTSKTSASTSLIASSSAIRSQRIAFLPTSSMTSRPFSSTISRKASSAPVKSTTPASEGKANSSSSSAESEYEGEEGPDQGGSRPSFRQRMRYLWKRYGWWAFGVYNLWSLLDFSLTWALIHMLGADHIRKVENQIREYVGMNKRKKGEGEEVRWPLGGREPAIVGGNEVHGDNTTAAQQAVHRLEHGVDEAIAKTGAMTAEAARKVEEEDGGGSGTLWAEAVLAYTIHKTLLLPFRVMATGALTPTFVKYMVRLGWARPLPPMGKVAAGTIGTSAKVTEQASSLASSGAKQAAKGSMTAGGGKTL